MKSTSSPSTRNVEPSTDERNALSPLIRAIVREVIAELAPHLAPSGALDLLSLEQARAIVKHRTTRQLREAIRRGELAATGNQRARTVKRSDLLQWITETRAKTNLGPSNDRIEARMARIARERKGAA